MKRIVCEMCGSTDLIKDGGVFSCQTCGCKYSVEEARELMVEIDNSKKINNLRERARKSIEVDDLEHAAEYFKDLLDENPNDWEAYFYSYLGEHTTYTNAQAGNVATKLGNTIPSAYDMAVSNQPENLNECFTTITNKTVDRIISIASSATALLRNYEGGDMFTAKARVNSSMYQNMKPTVSSAFAGCISALTEIEKKLMEYLEIENGVDKATVYSCLLRTKEGIHLISNTTFIPSIGMKERLIKDEVINKYAEEINVVKSTLDKLKEEKVKQYWENHPDEKSDYDKKILSIDSELEQLQNGIYSLEKPYDDVIMPLKVKTSKMFFAGKIYDEIQRLEVEKASAIEAPVKRIEKKIEELKIERKKIEDEFNKKSYLD